MEGEEIQPTRISKDEYVRFKQYVQDVHGKTRGHLSTEIENALREYRQPDNSAEPIQRIEQDIATIKAQLADGMSDGGTVPPTPSADPDTHARADTKPAANQPRTKKYAYLIEQLFAGKRPESPSGGELAPKTIRMVITDNYDSDAAIVEEWVAGIQKRLGREYDAEPHPGHGKTLVWGDKLDAARDDD